MGDSGLTRRELLRLGGAGIAALWIGGGTRAAAQEASDMLRLGFIGTGGRGTHLMRLALDIEGVVVSAVCDIDDQHLTQALEIAEAAQGSRPRGFGAGAYDYRHLLNLDDVDAVVIATPMQLHAEMAVDALRAGKHVLSEVAAAVTLAECHELVRAVRETGLIYMLAENVCYYQHCMALMQMIEAGLFGEMTYAECGYVHDCRSLMFKPDGSLTWRGELSRDCAGNWYPTHAIGPVAQWLGIGKSDRMEQLVSYSTRQVGLAHYAREAFGLDPEPIQTEYAGDSNTCLIRTERGRVIELRFDVCSNRPTLSTTYFSLQGATASFEDRVGQRVYVEGRSPAHAWEDMAAYLDEFEHPLFARLRADAEGSGHGGADYFVVREFIDCLRQGTPPPIDVIDAAAWSCIIPLSGVSATNDGEPQTMPDYRL